MPRAGVVFLLLFKTLGDYHFGRAPSWRAASSSKCSLSLCQVSIFLPSLLCSSLPRGAKKGYVLINPPSFSFDPFMLLFIVRSRLVSGSVCVGFFLVKF